jgi:hypothetical protein
MVAVVTGGTIEKEAHGEFESEHPGYCGAQDTFYVGNLKGVGRIYQRTFIDTYTKVSFAKLYDRKTPITAADLLNDRVLPFFEEYDVKLLRVLTDRGSEFCGNPERHEYELYLEREIENYKESVPRSVLLSIGGTASNGVDYLNYPGAKHRFGMNYGLLSVTNNQRLWLKVFLDPTMETGPRVNSPRDENVLEQGDPGLKVVGSENSKRLAGDRGQALGRDRFERAGDRRAHEDLATTVDELLVGKIAWIDERVRQRDLEDLACRIGCRFRWRACGDHQRYEQYCSHGL